MQWTENGIKIVDGHYLLNRDKPPLSLSGYFQMFDNKGSLTAQGFMIEGNLYGLSSSWDRNRIEKTVYKWKGLLIFDSNQSPNGISQKYAPIPPLSVTPAWANSNGIDQYGYWIDLSIKGVKQRLRWCPPGSFIMGCGVAEINWAYTWSIRNGWSAPKREWFENAPAHQVTLSRGFWMADSTCTRNMWKILFGTNSEIPDQSNEMPIENISWSDTQQCLLILGHLAGIELVLPSEAQWEYACRAKSTSYYFFGDDPEKLIDYANSSDQNAKELLNGPTTFPWLAGRDGFPREAPVKSFKSNDWGLFDMYGNVWQYCSDWYGAYPQLPVVDPLGPENGTSRVMRGGCWLDAATLCRSAFRMGYSPDKPMVYAGFRFTIQSK